jgi:hypothetical protein
MSHATHPLLPFDLTQRRRETAPGTHLGALADGLAAELSPWLDSHGELPIPAHKARLTRIGGRCPVHGIYLDFDPQSPHAHRCRVCDRAYAAPEHDDWWAMGAQLYSAERAVHAAALHALRGDPAHRALAERILTALAARYLTYPNRDNVLGPTRPFFSTYLESIWLLNVCQALALLELTGATPIAGTLRAELLEPSRALIAGYHEHRSNRQVWNAAAVVAATVLLGPSNPLDAYRFGDGGLAAACDALDDTGAWYEGENYHLFAHRGLWYGVQLWRAQGRELPGPALSRYRAAFRSPFAGLLPDDTFPSRRDSQYRVSMRQWRNAEYLELGFAECDDDRIAGLLHRLYDGSVVRHSDARARSTADAERHEPASALSRASGSWRALLMASAAELPNAAWEPPSVARPSEGLAVIRRDRGRVYVALEGGDHGGGHGHPDRLALTLQTGATRWLDDPGAGSYVDRSLFWYRSTLAHHAPLVNGRSQRARDTRLTHFDDRGGAGWLRKMCVLDEGVTAERAIIVCDGYLVDVLTWRADHDVTITLPLAAHLPTIRGHGTDAWQATTRAGAGGLEDGFGFLQDVEAMALIDGKVECSSATHAAGDRVRAWYASTPGSTLLRAMAPGAPGEAPATRIMLEAHGAAGCIVGVWEWSDHRAGVVDRVQLDPHGEVRATVTTIDGTTASHGPAQHGWHIGLIAGHAKSSIDLEGEQTAPVPPAFPDPRSPGGGPTDWLDVPMLATATLDIELPLRGARRIALGQPHYVATDEPYGGANQPEALVELGCTTDALVIRVTVMTGHAVVTPGGAPDHVPDNPLDNESADVNADGVQWYIGPVNGTEWWRSELAVPVGSTTLRRSITAAPNGPWPDAAADAASRWLPDDSGWVAQFVVSRRALPASAARFNLIVNERPPNGERRRGQLRLAGGGGFGYLRGDRDETRHCTLGLSLPSLDG